MSETREQPKLLVTGPQPAHQQSNLAPDTKPHTPLTTKLNSESLMSLLQKKAKIFKIQRKKQGNEIFERYSRKEKSLGQLSKKFLEIFGKMRDEEVSLDSVTDRLGVERRRIYDIINILESLGVVFRRGKNHYYWIGLVAISRTITNIENDIRKNSLDMIKLKTPKTKEKSLGFLAIGFIKLFIGWRNIITLEQAAQKLTLTKESHKLKTKIRRLYDIANVFLALGIIKKAYLPNRKPAFSWNGLYGLLMMMRKLGNGISLTKEEPVRLNKKGKRISKKEEIYQQCMMNQDLDLWKMPNLLRLKRVMSEDKEVKEMLKGVEIPKSGVSVQSLELKSSVSFPGVNSVSSPVKLPITGRSAFNPCTCGASLGGSGIFGGSTGAEAPKVGKGFLSSVVSKDGIIDDILAKLLNKNATPEVKKLQIDEKTTTSKKIPQNQTGGYRCISAFNISLNKPNVVAQDAPLRNVISRIAKNNENSLQGQLSARFDSETTLCISRRLNTSPNEQLNALNLGGAPEYKKSFLNPVRVSNILFERSANQNSLVKPFSVNNKLQNSSTSNLEENEGFVSLLGKRDLRSQFSLNKGPIKLLKTSSDSNIGGPHPENILENLYIKAE